MVAGAQVGGARWIRRPDIAGVLPVDKAPGPTSHDVVDQVRKRLRIRKVGHTGTLDPFASGVLVLCVGRATRLARFVSAADKEYTAEIAFGEETDTLDPTGRITAKADCSGLTQEDAARTAARFVGEFDQTPPRFSAVKIDGHRAYSLARRGEEFEGKTKRVRASSIEVTGFEGGTLARATLQIECSSGFYVRALARDLGAALSCPAMLSRLRRVRVGDFGIDSCLALSDVRSGDEGRAQLLGMGAAVAGLPRVELAPGEAARLCAGQSVPVEADMDEGSQVAVLTEGDLVAVAVIESARLKPKVVLCARN
jgi:tRNA pseudouridine55 synthase